MKLKSGLISVLLVLNLICFSQTINVHSITHQRQPNGGQYTLDGTEMATGGRLKLLNAANFGTGGVYSKPVSIVDGFASSNSLTQVVNFPYTDLFLFGSFDKNDGTLIQFTNEETDSLYNWSKWGGKLIICGSSGDGSYNPSVLNSKWGFQITNSISSSFIPNSVGLNTDIFNGSFGTISTASQGGGMRGYFSLLPSNVSVLATDLNNHPTIIMDCTTLDLIVADIDGYTTLDGLVSVGSTITNDQDKYFANTFVFMDKLQALPTINLNGFNLNIPNVYNGYEWYKNDSLISGSNSNITINQQGQYYVKVTMNGGCKVKSNVITADATLGIKENATTIDNIKTYPNPTQQSFNIQLPNQQNFNLLVYDVTGRKIYQRTKAIGTVTIDCSSFTSGIYFVQAVNEKNSLSCKLIKQ